MLTSGSRASVSSLSFSLVVLAACSSGGDNDSQDTNPIGASGFGGETFGVGGAPGASGSFTTPGAGGSPPVVGAGGTPGAGGIMTTGAGGSPPPTGAGGAAPAVGGAAATAGGAMNLGGEAGMGGEAGAMEPSDGGPPPMEDRPPCMKNPSQVVQIGDSYMNWGTHTFPTDLNAAGGVTYRPTNAIGGTSMGSGGIGLIPDQFETAIRADPDIIAVVMDGGGNDLLIPALGRPDCKNMSNAATVAGCQQIVTDGIAASTKLMARMADAGVRDVIFFFYPHVPNGTLLGGSSPNVMLDYALPLVKEACDSAVTKTAGKLRCWFLDTIPIFEPPGQAAHTDWFAPNDIHENSKGSKAITEAIVTLMKEHCVGQPESSGCCQP